MTKELEETKEDKVVEILESVVDEKDVVDMETDLSIVLSNGVKLKIKDDASLKDFYQQQQNLRSNLSLKAPSKRDPKYMTKKGKGKKATKVFNKALFEEAKLIHSSEFGSKLFNYLYLEVFEIVDYGDAMDINSDEFDRNFSMFSGFSGDDLYSEDTRKIYWGQKYIANDDTLIEELSGLIESWADDFADKNKAE